MIFCMYDVLHKFTISWDVQANKGLRLILCKLKCYSTLPKTKSFASVSFLTLLLYILCIVVYIYDFS